jgi:hypothetical protein
VRRRLEIDLPRPRTFETMGTSEFTAYKREILSLIHEESLREAGLAR